MFLGHHLPGALDESVLRYAIYYFHMPMFMGESGFLVKRERALSPIGRTVRRLVPRLVLPWAVALVVYYVVLHHGNMSATGFVGWLHRPYYHLWYIPAHCVYLVTLQALARIPGVRLQVLLAVLVVLSLAVYAVYDEGVLGDDVLGDALYLLRPQFFAFFIFGHMVRLRVGSGSLGRVVRLVCALGTVLCAALYLRLFGMHSLAFAKGPLVIASNGRALVIQLDLALADRLPRCRTVERIGENSLFICPYHVLEIRYVVGKFTPCLVEACGPVAAYSLGLAVWFLITLVVDRVPIENRRRGDSPTSLDTGHSTV